MSIYFNGDDHTESICVYVDDSYMGQHVTPQDVQTDYLHNGMSYKDLKLISRSLRRR